MCSSHVIRTEIRVHEVAAAMEVELILHQRRKAPFINANWPAQSALVSSLIQPFPHARLEECNIDAVPVELIKRFLIKA